MTALIEFRAGVELRSMAGGKLGGYAVKFGSVAQINSLGRSFRERVLPGAFSATLVDRHDVPALVDHDPSKLLGRTGNRTLVLTQDAAGLAFELTLPDTTLGRDTRAMAERRDLAGMSIGFRIAPGGDAWPAADMRELRTIDLVEVSIAQCWPAYPDTEVTLRHRQSAPLDGALAALGRRRTLDMLR